MGYSIVDFHLLDPDQAMALVPLGYFDKFPNVNLIAGTVEEETLFGAASDLWIGFVEALSKCLHSILQWAQRIVAGLGW
eukprot:gene33587-40631_t